MKDIGCLNGCDKNLLNVLVDNNSNSGSNTEERTQQQQQQRTFNNVGDITFPSVSDIFDSGIGFSPENTPQISSSSSSSSNNDLSIPKCFCQLPAISRVVTKLGQNHGKLFYTCNNQNISNKCNFFQWALPDGQTGNHANNNAREKTTKKNVKSTVSKTKDANVVKCHCSVLTKK